MVYHRPINFHALRGVRCIFTTLVLLLCASTAAGGSISSTHKNSSPQQNIVVQQQQMQQQQHLQSQQQHLQSHQQQLSQPQQQQHQQQQPSQLQQNIQQDNNRAHMRPHDDEEHERMSSLTQLSTIATGSGSSSSSGGGDASNTEYMTKDVGVGEDMNDPYQYLNELKVEPRLTAGNGMPWNPFTMPHNQPFSQAPTTMLNSFPYNSYGPFGGNTLPPPMMMSSRLMPFFSYPQPFFIPLPMYFAPTDLLYPGYGGTANEFDESMSRAVGDQRDQSSHFDSTRSSGSGAATARNSQIYFMRFAPMPYMFMSSLGFAPAQPTLPAIQPYAAVPAAISPILNIPLNFVANGRPTGIYQMGGAPNDFSNSMQYNNVNPFGIRPPGPLSSAFSLAGANRPIGSGVGSSFSSQGSYGMTSPSHSISHSLQPDSKMTLLKRPFLFNGRPEEIYTLPNNFNALYSNSEYY